MTLISRKDVPTKIVTNIIVDFHYNQVKIFELKVCQSIVEGGWSGGLAKTTD